MSKIKWLTEEQAAEKVGRKPRTLRIKVTSGEWKVNYTCLNGRGYQYSEEDIETLLLKNSTVLRKVNPHRTTTKLKATI